MRRAFSTIAVITAASLLLAACGSDDSSADDSGSETAAAGDPSEVSGKLTFWDTSDPTNEGPVFKQLVKRFEAEYPNVSVKYQSVPFDDAQNKFKTAAAAGSGAPDILRAEVAWVPEFASLGYLYALDGTPLLEDADDYLQTPMSSTKYNGKTYGVPQVTDALALMYNKSLFEKAGIDEPPSTWDEVESAAETIESETDAKGIYLNPTGYYLLPFMYGEGGNLVDVDNETVTVNSDANVTGIQKATDLIESGAAVQPAANDAYGNMMTMFSEGKVAMMIQGPWEVANIGNSKAFGGLSNLGVAPVPAGSEQAGSPVGGHDYVVYSGMDESKADAAMAFISFMNSAESQAFIADELGLLPTRKSAYELGAVENNPTVAAFQPVIEEALPRPWIPEGGQFFAPLDDMAIEMMIKGTKPEAALDKVAKTYSNEIVPDYSLN